MTRTLSAPAARVAIAQAERLLRCGIWQDVAMAAAVGLAEHDDPEIAQRARVLLGLYWPEAQPVGLVVELPTRNSHQPAGPANGGDAA